MIREHRFREAMGLLSIIGALILVLGYCQLHKQKFGVFNISSVSQVNQFHIILQSGLYRYGSDPAINEQLSLLVETWKKENPEAIPGNRRIFRTGTNNDFLWKYIHGMPEYQRPGYTLSETGIKFPREYIKNTIRSNLFRYALYSLGKFYEIRKYGFEARIGKYKKKISTPFVLELKFQSVYVFLLLEIVTLVAVLYFARRIPWFWCVCWLLTAGTIFTAVVGAQGEWTRLVIPALPLVILLIAKYVDLFVYVIKEHLGHYMKEQCVLLGNYAVQYLKEQD